MFKRHFRISPLFYNRFNLVIGESSRGIMQLFSLSGRDGDWRNMWGGGGGRLLSVLMNTNKFAFYLQQKSRCLLLLSVSSPHGPIFKKLCLALSFPVSPHSSVPNDKTMESCLRQDKSFFSPSLC